MNLDRTLVPDPDGVGAQPSELYLNNGNGTQWTKVADPNQVLNDGSLRYAHLTSTGPGNPQVILTSNSFAFAIDTVKTGSATLVAEPNPVNTTAGLDDNASNMRDIALGDINGEAPAPRQASREPCRLALATSRRARSCLTMSATSRLIRLPTSITMATWTRWS